MGPRVGANGSDSPAVLGDRRCYSLGRRLSALTIVGANYVPEKSRVSYTSDEEKFFSICDAEAVEVLKPATITRDEAAFARCDRIFRSARRFVTCARRGSSMQQLHCAQPRHASRARCQIFESCRANRAPISFSPITDRRSRHLACTSDARGAAIRVTDWRSGRQRFSAALRDFLACG